MDRPGVRQVPEGSGEQGKMEKTGCKIIRGAPTTLAVKGLLMLMKAGGSPQWCTSHPRIRAEHAELSTDYTDNALEEQ